MAYLRDGGVVVHDFKADKRRVVAGFQTNLLENIHGDRAPEGRALSFSPDGRWLAFAGEKKQRDYLYLYDTKRDRLRRVKTPFEQIRSPQFHPAGDRLVVVGMKNATNDLYEITTRGKLLRRLTDSPSDENQAVYSPDGNLLVYSQEVLVPNPVNVWESTRSVAVSTAPAGKLHPERNLMGMNLATLAAAPLTDLPGDDMFPAFMPDGNSLVFVGSPDAIYNLYRLDLSSGAVTRLTKVIGGNFAPDVARDGSYLLFGSLRKGSQQIYKAEPSLWTSSSAVSVAGVQPAAVNWTRLVTGQGAPTQTAAAARGRPSLSDGAAAPPAPDASVDMTPPAPFTSEAGDALFTTDRRPYRFRASTDLFFPLFYYSSTDGLFLAALWQASEYLGNHQLGASVQYASGERFLDYEVQYMYARFRPQFFLGAGGKSFYRDFSRTELRRETDLFTGVLYPLDRFNRLETVVSSIYRADEYTRFRNFNVEERENAAGISFVRDTTGGRYLAVTSGHRARATYQVARPVAGGDRSYNTHSFEYHHFEPTGRERTIAFRGLAGISVGKSPELFRLGGLDRVRGYSRNDDSRHAPKYVTGNLEWRVPMKYLKSYTWFIFPDFFFKAVYGTVFTDAGYGWTNNSSLRHLRATDALNSVGAGLRVPTFVLQTFPVTFSVDVVKRTDHNTWVWYFGLGPRF